MIFVCGDTHGTIDIDKLRPSDPIVGGVWLATMVGTGTGFYVLTAVAELPRYTSQKRSSGAGLVTG